MRMSPQRGCVYGKLRIYVSPVSPAPPSSVMARCRMREYQDQTGMASVMQCTANVSVAIVDEVAGVTVITSTPKLPAVKAVLFDVDGTLCASDPLHFLAFQEILLEEGFNAGVPISESFFNEHISGRHNPLIAADLFPQWSVERRDAFSADKERRYRKLVAEHGIQQLPGLSGFLQLLRDRGIRMVAVTNAPKDNVTVMLQALGLEYAFETVVYGEECAHAKPHPEPYLVGMRFLGIDDPTQVLVVEDSPSGIKAGVAAGAAVAALTTGHSAERLTSAGASLIANDFFQLSDYLTQ